MKLSDKKIYEYGNDPIHLRTIKLFRWHIDKETSCTLEELKDVVKNFSIKYDIEGDDFLYPILIALTNSVEKTDLITLLHSLSKERAMRLMDNYLKSKMNK